MSSYLCFHSRTVTTLDHAAQVYLVEKVEWCSSTIIYLVTSGWTDAAVGQRCGHHRQRVTVNLREKENILGKELC